MKTYTKEQFDAFINQVKYENIENGLTCWPGVCGILNAHLEGRLTGNTDSFDSLIDKYILAYMDRINPVEKAEKDETAITVE